MPDRSARTATSQTEAAWDVAELQRLLAAPARTASGWTRISPEGRPVIPLTAGVPDDATFPAAEIEAAVRTVLAREAPAALAYLLGTPQGEPALRRIVVEQLEPEPGLQLSEANVTITSGAAHALENVMRTFLDPGDVVLVEAPTYGGAVRTAEGSSARFASVAMDDQGMRMDALADTLERLEAAGERPKLIYTIPTFHNPAGTTLPLERRRQLVEIAASHRVLILEDDAYSRMRFSGEPLPSLFAVAGGVGVLRCGTVSKTIAPGLRVGWITAQPELINALVRMRFDNGTSPFAQRLVCAYVESGVYEPHVEQMRRIYQRKFETMDAALAEHLGRSCSWTEPQGGFYVWVKLPAGVDCEALQRVAWEEGVSFFPGTSFFTDGSGHDHLRLAFSAVSLDQIREGVALLGRALARVAA
jgi:DNA-binding transcriptional MocR family regulator